MKTIRYISIFFLHTSKLKLALRRGWMDKNSHLWIIQDFKPIFITPRKSRSHQFWIEQWTKFKQQQQHSPCLCSQQKTCLTILMAMYGCVAWDHCTILVWITSVVRHIDCSGIWTNIYRSDHTDTTCTFLGPVLISEKHEAKLTQMWVPIDEEVLNQFWAVLFGWNNPSNKM